MVFGTTGNVKQLLDGSILERFSALDQGGKVAAEYVWLGGSMSDLRSKTKTLSKAVKSVADLPDWNYDGSSTGQAPGDRGLQMRTLNSASRCQSLNIKPVSESVARPDWLIGRYSQVITSLSLLNAAAICLFEDV